MATNGWIGEQTVHSWGSYNSRLTTNVYINGIRRYSDHIDVSGVIYLFCKSSGARTVWYDWAITAWCGGGSLGQIKPRTYNNNILGKSWSKNFSIRINCSNSATSATFQVGFSDSNMGGKDKYWTLYFDRYATSPSGISSTATYTQYSTISTSCSGINWGQGYSNRRLTCVASYTYNGKTENFTLGAWTDGATSKSVTKSDFNFPADLNVTVKWTASTNIGSTSSTAQIRVKQTFPAPNLSNTTFTAESTAPYCIRVNVSGVDFGDNYSAQKLELYGTYELDGIIYDNKLGEISNQTSWTLEYDASQEAEPWTKIPDDSSILLRLVADNGNRTSDKTIIINCQSSYEAYVIEHIPEEEKEKSETYAGKNIQIQNAPKDAPLADFKIDGETSQQTYSGKNLLKPYSLPSPISNYSGLSSTLRPDGSITISGTASADAWIEFGFAFQAGTQRQSTALYSLDSSSTYTLSSTISGTRTGNCWLYTQITSNGTEKASILGSSTSFTGADGIYRSWLRIASGASFTNVTICPQLEKSSSATAWEPYTGSVPAPNPSYPQAVQTVTGENVVKITGKNLLKLPSAGTNAGVTYSINSDGTFNIHGTNNSGYEILFSLYLDSDEFQFVNYTLGARESLPYGLGCRCEIYRGGTWKRSFISVNSTRQTQTGTPDFTDANRVRVAISVANGATVNIDNVGIQLEKGSSASSFEPFQEQNYEINLGKNLFDKDNASEVINAYIDTSAHKITTGSSYKLAYIKCESNTTYTVSKIAGKRFRVATTSEVPANNVSTSGEITQDTGTSIIITTDSMAKYLCVFLYHSSYDTLTPEQILATLQIEKGSQVTTYAPYFTPIELCKIGDYQDYIYKSGGKWYVHKEVDRKNLNGSEDWGLAERSGNSNGVFYIDYNKIGTIGAKNNGAFSNYARFISGFVYLVGQFDTHYSQWRFYAPNNTITLNEWKTNLGATPLVLYYLPATPTDAEITNEALVTQLNALFNNAKTYAGTNNIFTITPNEQGTLEIQYYTKWQNTSPAILSANGRNGTGNFKQVRRIGTK